MIPHWGLQALSSAMAFLSSSSSSFSSASSATAMMMKVSSSSATWSQLPPGRTLFVYGTLMAPEVVHGLLGRSVAQRPAQTREPLEEDQAPGYIRRPVRGQVYPGMIRKGSAEGAPGVVRGRLLVGLTSGEMQRLDWFEGSEYQRITLQVQVEVPPPLDDPQNQQQEPMEAAKEEAGADSRWMVVVETETYLWSNPVEDLDWTWPEEDWSYDKFRQEKLSWYLTATVQPCRSQCDQQGF